MKKIVNLRLILLLQAILFLTPTLNFAQRGRNSSYVSENSVSSNSATINWNADPIATGYTVRYRPVGNPNWLTTTTILTSAFLENLNSSTDYEFQVSANTSVGRATYSASEFFHTNSACVMPEGLNALSLSATSAQLSWNAQSGVSYYKIRYRVVGATAWINDSSSTNSKVVTGLTSSSSYQFQVQAKCSASEQSAWGSKFTFSTTLNTTCNAPDELSANSVTDNGATLNWRPVTGAVSYNLQYARVGSNTWTTVSTTSPSSVIDGLDASTTYNYRVQAIGYGASSLYAPLASFSTVAAACSVPTLLAATSVTSTSARLTWGVVSGASSYSIQYRQSGTSSWTTLLSTTNSKDITGLIQNTSYQFKVRTICSSSSSSSYSSSVSFTTAGVNCGMPDVYYFGTINKTSSSATIYWTAISGSAGYNVRYKVYNSSAAWTSLAATAATLNLTGLAASTKYEFQVQTICSGGTSAFSASGVFTTTAFTCNVPTLSTFVLSSVTNTTATLGWSNVAGSNGYNIQYRVNGSSSWNTLTTISNSKTLSGLTIGTTYQYQIQTICSGGNSAFSASATFTTTGVSCGIPDVNMFTSTNKTSNSAKVGWKSLSGASGYNVQYRVRNSGAAWSTVSATTNTVTISGLNASTWYEFQVQTLCSAGTGGFSASGIFQTSVGGSLCGIPSGLSVSSIASTSATLAWTTVSGATTYNVRYKRTNSSTWIVAPSANTTESITGLSAGAEYEFQVQTICSAGTGDYSASNVFMTTVGSNACGIPDGLSVSGITSATASLTWNAISGATSYVVRYKKTSVSTWTTAPSTNLTESISALAAGSAYEFQVQSVCAVGSSAFSASYVFTTLSTGTASLPVPDHIVIVMFENHAFSEIIGNSAAPHINAFSQESNTTLFTESYGITHPSQPNYLHFFSGSNQGVTNNVKPSSKFTTMNLAAALLQAGLTYKSYADGMPSIGYDGEVSGSYQRKHNPVTNWVGTGTNQVPASLNMPFTSFPTDYSTLPTVCFVSPDMNNSMHDGGGNSAITTGDNWFYNKIYPYAQWAKTHNSLLIFTFDEDNNVSGNRITTIFSGQMVTQGQNSTGINHYNVLRTIEDMYGLAHSGNAANASPIHGCWVNGFRVNNSDAVEDAFRLKLFPNPVVSELNINYTLPEVSDVAIRLLDVTGKLVKEDIKPGQVAGAYEVKMPVDAMHISRGVYFVEMTVGETRLVKRIVVGE